jgi:hypothetical protein
MQQIELNLQEIEKIRESNIDQEKEAKEQELQKQFNLIFQKVESIEDLTS